VTDRLLSGLLQADLGAALPSPSALYGRKDPRLVLNNFLLLFRGEFYHSPAFVRTPKGCKDFPAHAEIRMPHVGILRGIGHAEGDAAEVVGGHRRLSAQGVHFSCTGKVFDLRSFMIDTLRDNGPQSEEVLGCGINRLRL
jgi:hypothetical protein